MDNILFRAILSMDAYNRGYAPGTIVSGSQIGDATIYKDATDSTIFPDGTAQAIGFYAIAYTVPGGAVDGIASDTTVISYRGTTRKPALIGRGLRAHAA